MSINNISSENVLLDDNLDGGWDPIILWWEKMDNEYAQLIQDLLEIRS